MINNKILNATIVCFLGVSGLCSAQTGAAIYGNTYVGAKGALSILNADLTINTIVKTQKTGNIGKIAVTQNGNIAGVGADKFIDGYVRSYKLGENLFPVGVGTTYRPVVINLETSEFVDVAYNNSAYSSLTNGSNVFQVSSKEYWDVLGQNKGKVKLTWTSASGIANLVSSLSDLGIVGWDGSKWEAVATIQSAESTATAGTIETKSAVDFSKYSAFTFAKVDNLAMATSEVSMATTLVAISQNVFAITSSEAYASADIYDLSGKKVQHYAFSNEKKSSRNFPYNKGVYIVNVTLSSRKIISKKIMHR